MERWTRLAGRTAVQRFVGENFGDAVEAWSEREEWDFLRAFLCSWLVGCMIFGALRRRGVFLFDVMVNRR